jgi:hypothetical protein
MGVAEGMRNRPLGLEKACGSRGWGRIISENGYSIENCAAIFIAGHVMALKAG